MRDKSYQEAIYNNWKDYVDKNGIDGIGKKNSKLIFDYICDMETGLNMSKSKRGQRSFKRMNVTRALIVGLTERLEARGVKNLEKTTSKDFAELINDMRKGVEATKKGGKYSECSISDFVRIFKAFWNWHKRVQKKEGIIVEDITEDFSGNYAKTRFVYITKEQLEEMLPYLSEEEQMFSLFLFDSIMRCPSEVFSLKMKDIFLRDGEVWVNIPDEASKTYGRVFNLLYCGEAIKKYIKDKNSNEYLWDFNYKNYLSKIKKVAVQVLGEGISHPKAEKKFSELGGYDFRHSGSIHLRVLAQKNNSISLDSIRQRGGWNDFEMLNYYTRFIGLTGKIEKEALLIQEDKSRLEKELEKVKRELRDNKIFQKEMLKNFESLNMSMKK